MKDKEDIFENSIIPTDKLLPSRLNIIPLQGRPIFPNIFTPLMLNSTEDIKIVDEAYEQGGFIGIVMVKNETESPTYSDLFKIGTVARIIRKVNLPDGGINIFISTIKRFKLRKSLHNSFPISAAVEYLEDEESDTFEVKALTRAIIS